jgi:hypothetical protein
VHQSINLKILRKQVLKAACAAATRFNPTTQNSPRPINQLIQPSLNIITKNPSSHHNPTRKEKEKKKCLPKAKKPQPTNAPLPNRPSTSSTKSPPY